MSHLPQFILEAATRLNNLFDIEYFDYSQCSGRYFDESSLHLGFYLIYSFEGRSSVEIKSSGKSSIVEIPEGSILAAPAVYEIDVLNSSRLFQIKLSHHCIIYKMITDGVVEALTKECHFCSDDSQSLLKLFKEFQESYHQKGEISRYRTSSIAAFITAEVLRIAVGYVNSSFEGRKSRESYARLVIYLGNNFHRPFDAAEAAESLDLSVQYLSMLTNDYRRMSFKNLVNFYRLEKSRKMLTDTDYAITDIALSCGFNGSAYYIKVFRTTYGLTPLQCRKKSKNADKNFHKVLGFVELKPLNEMPEVAVEPEDKVSMVVANSLKRAVNLSWHNPFGPEATMHILHPGDRVHMGTGVRECWIVRELNGDLIGYYHVSDKCCQILI